jgi:hypothetical protein
VRERAYKLSASYSRLRAPPRVDVVLVCAAFGGVPQIAHRGTCKSRCVADERHRLPRRDGMTGMSMSRGISNCAIGAIMLSIRRPSLRDARAMLIGAALLPPAFRQA